MRLLSLLIFFLLSSTVTAAVEFSFEDCKILSISERDGLAVVKHMNEQIVLKEGRTTIHGYFVKNIGSQRITLESKTKIILLSPINGSKAFTKDASQDLRHFNAVDITLKPNVSHEENTGQSNSITFSKSREEI